MKRVFLFLLVLCTLLTAIPAFGVNALSEDESAKDATLPSSYTLVGTKHLPPISNQGNIGTCSSSSITYMQFSNAVSRYIHSIDPDTDWNPSSGEAKYLFSPKFTYNFAGSGTAWVYNILIENGALTWDKSHFATKADGSYDQEPVKLGIPTQTTSWDVGVGAMEDALNYRLNNFEQIWVSGKDDSYGVDGKVQVTNTEKGQALINKIKDAVIHGNVVVTGGLSSTWGGGYQTNAVVANTKIAKKGDSVLYCGRGDKSGGHQICIVGYDDEIEADVTNVYGEKTRLKGAFLIANSWGEGWQNDGYCWFMYDSINEVSEYDELNFSDRQAPLDQFCFVYWDKDVTVGLPDLYMEVSVMAYNRNAFSMQMVAVNEAGLTRRYTPYLFEYSGHHGDYGNVKDYNFAGQPIRKNMISAGQFAFPCTEMYGSDINKFVKYGVKVTASNQEVKVLDITLKNSRGEVVSKVSFNGEDSVVGNEKTFYVDAVKLFAHSDLPTVDNATIEYVDAATYYTEKSEMKFTVTAAEGYGDFRLLLDGKELKADKDGVYTAKLTASSDLKVEYLSAPNDDTNDDGADEPASGNGDQNKKDDNGIPTVAIFVAVGVLAAVIVVVVVLIPKKKKK